MAVGSVLAINPFPNFQPNTPVSIIFIEHENHVLLLKHRDKDKDACWGPPGGKLEEEDAKVGALRELKEETQVELSCDDVTYFGLRYARGPRADYILHIFQTKLPARPNVVIDLSEHSDYEWVSIYAFKVMPTILAHREAFDLLYGNRLWQVLPPGSEETKAKKVASLTLWKGSWKLQFDFRRRLVIDLIGLPGAGKGTQAELLTRLYGILPISMGDLFRRESLRETKLDRLVRNLQNLLPNENMPDEIPIGMMVSRFSEGDCQFGFILDGFPRTQRQAEVLNKGMLTEGDVHIPIYLDVSRTDAIERIAKRYICPECGHQVRELDESIKSEYCPKELESGRKVRLIVRPQDVDSTKLNRRMDMFEENRDGVLQTLSEQDDVFTLQTPRDMRPRAVLHNISAYIQMRLDALEYDSRRSSKNLSLSVL